MADQAEEHRQMQIEADIEFHLNQLYEALKISDNPEAEELLGHVAEWKAKVEGDTGSFA